LAITIGILIAQLINYGAQYIHPWGWQLALGLAAIPAFTLSIGAYLLPETPNSLIERSHMTEGRRVLERIRGTEGEQEMARKLGDCSTCSCLLEDFHCVIVALLQCCYRHAFDIAFAHPELVLCLKTLAIHGL
jgi:hypothetical protein